MNRFYYILSLIYNPVIFLFLNFTFYENWQKDRIEIEMVIVFVPIIIVSVVSWFRVHSIYKKSIEIRLKNTEVLDSELFQDQNNGVAKFTIIGNIIIGLILLILFGVIFIEIFGALFEINMIRIELPIFLISFLTIVYSILKLSFYFKLLKYN